MRDLSRFATDDAPLHPSGLRSLIECPWRAAMAFMFPSESDEGGTAADTGSAMHAAAAAMHKGKGKAACLEHMGTRIREYPKADLADAASLFLAYAGDTRNNDAEIVLLEQPIKFQISPAESDPTQEAIQVEGTLDQVRRDGGRNMLWDIKTSKKDPADLLNKHIFQAAAYCIGASLILNEPVHPGGLIVPRKYRGDSTGPVFRHFTWTWNDIPQIMEAVRHSVARIRAGDLYHVPNDGCMWCAAKSPELCFPQLQRTLGVIRGK